MTLEGQVALVTGGSRGIGRAICVALAREGAAVTVNYRHAEADAREVVEEIEGEGGTAVAVRADVAHPDEAAGLVGEALSRFGRLDVLVNNAGIARNELIYEMGAEDWLDVMRVNFGGVFNCTGAVLPHFMAQRSGSIVNVSSVMGERGWIGQSNYSASKGAVNAFTRCSAVELARFGVRVNAVLPGFTPTDLVSDLLHRDGGRGITRQIPWRQFATPEQVASVVAFLAGPQSAYVTGTLVPVDGGAAAVLGVGRSERSA